MEIAKEEKSKVDWDINYVKWGIANRFNGHYIEINEGLKKPKYQKLHEEIIEHEKSHTENNFDFRDVRLDLFDTFKNKKSYWHFILTHPKSWVQFLPIYKSPKKGWSLDPIILIAWLTIGGMFAVYILVEAVK